MLSSTTQRPDTTWSDFVRSYLQRIQSEGYQEVASGLGLSLMRKEGR
jgi:hypothetical protein